MKRPIITALIGLMPFIAQAQEVAFQRQQDVTTSTTPVPSLAKSERAAYADKMLYEYRKARMMGSVMEIGGAGVVALNLIEMNRTGKQKSRYTPMFVIGGGFAVAGYVINHWVAPGYLEKAGVSLQGSGVSIDLHK
ncbi:MAG: hypothetical protein K0Q79_3774 [Flavipsychrobacter sp.]|jgi:hypothetical protein|nr:hypothetical protein [Flavipsychrobacter sp.]